MRTFLSGSSIAQALVKSVAALALGFLGLATAPFLKADQNLILVPGSTITIEVTADGTTPFIYQWQKEGVAIPGANSLSLVIPNATSASLGNYTAVVANAAGSTISDRAIISAAPIYPPAIQKQPGSLTVVPGDFAAFNVAASGTQPLSYQWRLNGVDISGATTDTYTNDSVNPGDYGNYTVVVSNGAGSVESNPAVLTDATVPPAFNTQLAGKSVLSGSTVTFSITADGTAPLTYQWRINGTNLANSAVVSGANTPTLTLTGVTTAYTAQYSVIASNSAGSASSSVANLTVSDPPPVNTSKPPTILTNPASVSAALGETVRFSATASGSPNPTYQWQKDGVDLIDVGAYAGSRTPNLTVTGVPLSFNQSQFRVVVTNDLGSATSSAATLVVRTLSPPAITNQPVNQIAQVGSVAFFTVGVSSYPNPTYQWKKNGVDLANGGNILGAQSQTLSINNVATADGATYSVTVSNPAGSVTSNDVVLTTNGTPSFNGAPAFVSQPPATTVTTVGAIVQLAVNVSGDPTPSLQWRKNGVNLTNGGIVTGATSSVLTLSGVTAADAANYSVVATNSLGSITSPTFALTVQESNVWNQTVTTGKAVALTAPNASGNVQWQVSSNAGSSWTDLANNTTYSGVTTGTLHIADANSGLNALLYRLVTVTNGTTSVLYSAKLNVTAAFVPFPVSVTADGLGNLYVADAANDTIEKINVSAQIATFAGTAGQTGTANGTGSAARFNDPSGVVAAFDGTLAVADKANGTIRLITPAGVVSTLAGSTTLRGNANGTGTAATFSSPLGIARDSADNYYVADAMNHTIRKVTSAGVVTTLAGTAGQAGTSNGNGAAARFNNPTGIAVDAGGTLFVADTSNNLIRKVTASGEVTTLAGLAGVSGADNGTGNLALFNQPAGLAVDTAGNVYVADMGNSTIRRVTPAGVVTTIAGLPGIAGHKDGAGIEAWFNQPRDVALSSAGFLYVADTGNASIRRIDQAGTVTTLALAAATAVDPTPTNPLPTTPTTPTLPTSPTPPSSGGGGGGGGGAPSTWFLGLLSLLWFLRRGVRRR